MANTQHNVTASSATTTSPLSSSSSLPLLPRYIAMPRELYALRRRFPSVLQSVLLECTRCRRWIAVDVLSAIPSETPLAPATSLLACGGNSNGSSSKNDDNDDESNTSVSQRASRRGADASASSSPSPRTTPWRSQRLNAWQQQWQRTRQHVTLLQQQQQQQQDGGAMPVDVLSDGDSDEDSYDVAPERRFLLALMHRIHEEHDAKNSDTSNTTTTTTTTTAAAAAATTSDAPTLYIPNPANFTCTWTTCERADMMRDLRDEWLGKLYTALASAQTQQHEHVSGGSSGGSGNNGTTLSSELARELCVRRSSRLAAHASTRTRSKKNKSDKDDDSDDSDRHRTGNNTKTHNNKTTTDDNGSDADGDTHGDDDDDDTAMRCAFCWVACDRCGKLRRVAQPFPGGAPFVCALVAALGSCATTEAAGVAAYTRDCAVTARAAAAADAAAAAAADADATTTAATASSTMTAANVSCASGGTVRDRQATSALQAFYCALADDPLWRAACAQVQRQQQQQQQQDDEAAQQTTAHTRRNGTSRQRARAATTAQATATATARTRQDERSGSRGHATHGGLDSGDKDLCSDDALCARRLPVLKQLALALRKRSTAGLLQQVAQSPRSLRRKRDEVLRSMAAEEGPTTGVATSTSAAAAAKATATRMRATHHHGGVVKPADDARHAARATSTATATTSNTRSDTDADEAGERAVATSAAPTATALPPRKRGRPRASDDNDGSGSSGNNNNNSGGGGTMRAPRRVRDTAAAAAATSTTTTRALQTHNKHKKKGKATMGDGDTAETTVAGSDADVVHWVLCDRCGKWRVVQQPVPKTLEYWECRMRDDNTTCEDTDDETRMQQGTLVL